MEFLNAEFNLQYHGDYLEQKEFAFIRTHLPAYEEIWKRYIGHDGYGKMPEVTLPPDMIEQRIHFGERMYTCLESIICMRNLSDEAGSLQIDNYEKYIKFLNILLGFQAHAGRVRDNVDKLVYCLIKSDKDKIRINKILNEYYQQRNTILHGKKIPFSLYEKAILIPIPSGENINPSTWNSNMRWKESSENDLVFFTEYIKGSFEGLTKHLNQVLNNLIDPIKSLVKELNISLIPYKANYNEIVPSGSISDFAEDSSFISTGVDDSIPPVSGSGYFDYDRW